MHDEDGQILAAAELDAEDDEGVVPRPVPRTPEQTVVELEVPEEYRRGDLREVCERLRVDPARRELVLREPGT